MTQNRRATERYRIHGAIAACALALATVTLGSSVARATPFTLGAFDQYGLLVNDGASGGDINTAPVDANIGIGNVTGPINLHNEVINGQVDVSGSASTAVAGGNITGTQPASLGGPAPATVNSNVAAVQTAIATAAALSSAYGAESALGTFVTINGTTTLNADSGFLDSSGARVFTANSFSIGNGQTVTINGSASDFVVIDVTGNSGNKLDGALTLAGGITPDQVLVNFMGVGGSVQGAANGATLEGTFLIPNQAVTLNSLLIDGHLFGGEAGTNFQFVSNAFISQPSETCSDSSCGGCTGSSCGGGCTGSGCAVPEPASLPIFGFGLLASAVFLARRQEALHAALDRLPSKLVALIASRRERQRALGNLCGQIAIAAGLHICLALAAVACIGCRCPANAEGRRLARRSGIECV